ncbi:thioesterase superfamily member 2, putative [Ichthyophthirius multifiliis]|uniref:Thioesterase superfamily member 2, putative n=1 Tax=Ichthyophthirius multifiliis TaxID=5932 RepID=G0QTD4_ICHMU|nr:thioesterase superfamily member 2, putative [Ichthyophthirius multifiliis]EGR31511.1 thioesterase superfamily member 2, putative [Ichthyophthirius multifiliis]|eukprot:XP_004034997.1 thioesterase superfamily member 2, putative [Ichthyophthirius multifiliis]
MSIKQSFKPLFQQFVNHKNLLNTFAYSIYQKFELIEESHELLTNDNQILLKYTVPQNLCNFFGVVHGGALATLVDCSTTLAILKKDQFKRLTTTIEISQHCLNPCNSGEEIFIRAECLKMGKNIAFAQSEIFNSSGKKLAVQGRQSKLVLPKSWENQPLPKEKI